MLSLLCACVVQLDLNHKDKDAFSKRKAFGYLLQIKQLGVNSHDNGLFVFIFAAHLLNKGIYSPLRLTHLPMFDKSVLLHRNIKFCLMTSVQGSYSSCKV